MSKYAYCGLILALVFMALPSFSHAQYYYPANNSYQITQIQAQLDALRAQLASMGYNSYFNQYNSGYNYSYPTYPYVYGTTGSVLGVSYLPTSSCNFTSDLFLGMTHPQVVNLNLFLGSGSSSYFDQSTYNAVVNFQNMYASEVLLPAGLSYASGFVGAFTRSKLNALCNGQYGYNGNVLGFSTYDPHYAYNYYNNYNYNAGLIPTLDLYVSNQNVNYNDTVTLNWNTTNVTSCNASGGWTGAKGQNGTETRTNITYATNFTLTCYGSGGMSVVKSVTATPYGNSTSGTPNINFYANPANVYSGGSTTLYWTVTNANICSASGSWSGSKGTSGNESVGNITNTRTYTLSCTSSTNQTTTQSVTVGVL